MKKYATPIINFLVLSVFVTLQSLDLYTTWLGLKLGIYENNPFMRAIVVHGGIWLVLLKLLGMVLSIALLYMVYPGGIYTAYPDISHKWRRILYYALMAGIELYLLYIVVKNTTVIMRLINK